MFGGGGDIVDLTHGAYTFDQNSVAIISPLENKHIVEVETSARQQNFADHGQYLIEWLIFMASQPRS